MISLYNDEQEKYIRHNGITDFIFNQAKELYGNKVSKEDIFFYVYGFYIYQNTAKNFLLT